MRVLIVVENLSEWPIALQSVDLVSAREYLRDEQFAALKQAQVYNLCKSYRYQSLGYYVSLLAAARGQRPNPSVAAIQDMKLPVVAKLASEELDDLIQRSLKIIRSDDFVLSIYFGKNLSPRYDRLCGSLFDLYESPLLRANFVRNKDKWGLQRIKPIPLSEVPENHREFFFRVAGEYFSRMRRRPRRKRQTRYDLAILYNPDDPTAPSDEVAIRRFCQAAARLRISTTLISKADYSRLAEFDALFIRETTAVNHYTYRFSRRAATEGLVVIDDPESIIRCTNKVFLAELLARHHIAVPQTSILHRENSKTVKASLQFPCVLKQPDSSSSLEVSKVDNEEELRSCLQKLFSRSELVVAQAFMPTPFDWRVGILNNKPIFACKYHMARNHWQITRWASGKARHGRVEAIALEQVPRRVLRTSLKAAALIGNGLYGVDVKYVKGTAYVIEVNDCPTLEAGYEDAVAGKPVYDDIMNCFLQRIEESKGRL